MDNEENLQNVEKAEQKRVQEAEAILSQVTGGGMAHNALTWAGINGSIGAIIANHKGQNVDKAVAVDAAIGAGISVVVDGASKVIMKRL